MRDARAVMHVGIVNPRWRGKPSRHSRRMHNPKFCVSGKRSMGKSGHLWPVSQCVCFTGQSNIGNGNITSKCHANCLAQTINTGVLCIAIVNMKSPETHFMKNSLIIIKNNKNINIGKNNSNSTITEYKIEHCNRTVPNDAITPILNSKKYSVFVFYKALLSRCL